jgi:flagellar export protein FliJ
MTRSKRVARIVDAKKRLRDRAVGELARAQEAVTSAQEHASYAGGVLDLAVGKLTRSGSLSADELMQYSEQVRRAERMVASAEGALREVTVVRDEKSELAHEAHREVKALETAGERYRRAEEHEALQRETREIEDVTNARSVR